MTERICPFCGLAGHVRRTHRNCTARIASTCESCGREGHRFNTHYSCPLNPAILRLHQSEQQAETARSNDNMVMSNAATTVEDISMEAVATEITEEIAEEIRDEVMEEVVEEVIDAEMEEGVPTRSDREEPVTSCAYCGSTTHRHRTSRQCPFNINNPHMMARDPLRLPTERDDRGRMDAVCPKCSATMWIEERTARSSKSNPLFQLCCCKGAAILEQLKPTPPLIFSLLTGSDERSVEFKSNIRCYNSSLSFSSMGVKLDLSLANMRSGNYTFRIQGSPYHLIGPALPQNGEQPKFAQIYIHDSGHELDNRMAIFPNINSETLRQLQDLMHTMNPFVEQFKSMAEIAQEQRNNATSEQTNINGLNEVRMIFRAEGLPDRRRYNQPNSFSEISVLIVGGEGTPDNQTTSARDIVAYAKGDGSLTRINELNQHYDPLHYVLLFPEGSPFWNISTVSTTTRTKVTAMAYYSSRLMMRPQERNYLHLFGKLFHQYIVDMYAKMEQSRLLFIYHNQEQLRADLYKGLEDALSSSDAYNSMAQLGRKVILPSSFTGGPRHMAQLYQDAMSIVRRFGKPDLFITFTCNPMWPEIQRELQYNQTASDRPDLCARVFNLKLQQMLEEITKGGIFGRVIGYVYTIEFLKRGLPHAHMLFIVHSDDKPIDVECYDNMICAEIPDADSHPLAYQTVTKNMIHGPCGLLNPEAPCMLNGECQKNFPKPFQSVTELDTNGYPKYRRRNNGRSVQSNVSSRGSGGGTVNVDNRWIVPHNLYLCTKFDAHINVESCASINAVKYIFKYVYKGHDRASVSIEENDEVKRYLDARYVSAPEACWRIFHFHIHKEYPPHQRLQVHLENEQTVYYRENENLQDVVSNAMCQETTLTAWFTANSEHPEARTILYPNFPEHFVWNTTEKPSKWTKRKNGNTIGRIYAVSPKQTEKYYLRMLLYHVPGATCFEDIRTVNGQLYTTYQEAAEALGLLESDNQWETCMNEASTFHSSSSLRNLYCIIVVFCSPSNPFELYLKFRDSMSEDILHKLQNDDTIDPALVDVRLRSYEHCLLELSDMLLGEYGVDISVYSGFELPQTDTRSGSDEHSHLPLLIREHMRMVSLAQAQANDFDSSCLNDDQRLSYEAILDAVDTAAGIDEQLLPNPNGSVFFVDGPGGTGKTFVFNALLFKVRREAGIALAVASSGTASLLLDGGRTSHSTFAIPLRVDETTVCHITPRSAIAKLLTQAKLIIWDETSMTSRYIFEAVDRTFRDILRQVDPEYAEIPFSGRVMVFGGDFRQILPVIPRGSRSDIISQCINMSSLWPSVKRLKLRVNMRVQQALVANDPVQAQDLQEFADKLLEIGDGRAETLRVPTLSGYTSSDFIKIPRYMIVPGNNLFDLLKELYPSLFTPTPSIEPNLLTSSVILTTKNKEVANINKLMLNAVPGEATTYLSADKAQNDEQQIDLPTEFLNAIDTGSLAPHTLTLKIGVPIMLLRNINPKNGLCNGTRLIVRSLLPNVIEALIATGSHVGNVTYIPRIKIFTNDDPSVSIPFERCQFPVRLAFCMTINKAQGQTMDRVGIYLPSNVFSHGQLYVAMSRVKDPKAIKIMIDKNCISRIPNNVQERTLYTRNVVFSEVFQ